MNKLYEETDIQNIANAIREKTKSTDTFKVSEMANAVANIQTGSVEKDVFTYQLIDTVTVEYVEAVDISRQAFNTSVKVE